MLAKTNIVILQPAKNPDLKDVVILSISEESPIYKKH
jgi:hypothetical protein